MADERCPECGAELPRAAGQHALTPSAGVVQCPTCGASVTLERFGARARGDDAHATGDVLRAPASVGGEEGAPESFSGEETVAGVLDELEHKPGGPEAAA